QVRQSIMKNCLKLFSDLNIQPLAEGVECHAEFAWLKAAGVDLMQGYYFAKPGFESLPSVNPEFSEA
ncbi:EAL domain-containing protein, partial [Vibrio cholerae]|uniref:EAL domain-containing protein n=1 Tax=Vibrio cholerae TaxID=666 RepID=UPI0018F05D24